MAEETSAATAAPKVKTRQPRQRACNEKDAKGKSCNGHLKRWFDFPKEVAAQFGAQAELYRCERCRTIYQPDTSEPPRSYTLRY